MKVNKSFCFCLQDFFCLYPLLPLLPLPLLYLGQTLGQKSPNWSHSFLIFSPFPKTLFTLQLKSKCQRKCDHIFPSFEKLQPPQLATEQTQCHRFALKAFECSPSLLHSLLSYFCPSCPWCSRHMSPLAFLQILHAPSQLHVSVHTLPTAWNTFSAKVYQQKQTFADNQKI